jgi:hypothetical protein
MTVKSYQFNINEGQNTATLTVKASDEQTAIQQAQQLLKSSDSLGTPLEVTNQQSQSAQSATA